MCRNVMYVVLCIYYKLLSSNIYILYTIPTLLYIYYSLTYTIHLIQTSTIHKCPIYTVYYININTIYYIHYTIYS